MSGAERRGRQCLHVDGEPARRPGNDAVLDHYQSAALRHAIVGLPYSHQGQMTLDEIVGGSPYGATTVAGGAGQRQPSALDLAGGDHQGKMIAETAKKLFP